MGKHAENIVGMTLQFNIDKTGLNQLQEHFASIKNEIKYMQNAMKEPVHFTPQSGKTTSEVWNTTMEGVHSSGKDMEKLSQLSREIDLVSASLNKSFNKNLGTINMTKFRQELSQSDIDFNKFLHSLKSSANDLPRVNRFFQDLNISLIGTQLQMKKTSQFMNDLMVSFGNTVKWGITSSIFNNITNSLQGAWSYAKKLDQSLNDIRIITGKSGTEMAKFAQEANKAAAALGKTTTDYTEASLIYYQQGLSEEDVKARTETTLRTANVTGQSTAAVSEQLTAVWNGYKVNAQEAELYIDKLAAVAAATAADLEELSTGMSKVASAANIMGVDIDQLSSQLATIISVTRQAPESVGTALKTIYARMGDIEAGKDAETSLDEYTKKMAVMGINVLDYHGKLRDTGTIIEEIGNKWTSLTREQQISLSQVVAGTRQYNNLLALFDNWDDYLETLEISKMAFGTLQNQQDIYMESTEAHLAKLEAAWEKVFDALFDNKSINTLLDGLAKITHFLGAGIQADGGGAMVLLGAFSSIAKLLKGQIGTEMANFAERMRSSKENAEQIKNTLLITQNLKAQGINEEEFADPTVYKTIIDFKQRMLELSKITSEEEQNQANILIKQLAAQEKEKFLLEEKVKKIKEFIALSAQSGEYAEGTFTPIEGSAATTLSGRPYYEYNREDQATVLTDAITQWSIPYAELNDINILFNQIMENAANHINLTEEEVLSLGLAIEDDLTNSISHLQQISNAGFLEILFENDAEAFREYQTLLTQGANFINQKKPTNGKEARQTFLHMAENYTNNPNQNRKAFVEYETWAQQFMSKYEEVTTRIRRLTEEGTDYVETQFKETFEKIEQEAEETKEKMSIIDEGLTLRETYAEITNLIGAFGQITSGITGIISLTKTLKDESLSTAEKVEATLSSLLFIIPMLINGLGTVGHSILVLGKNAGVTAAATGLAAKGVGGLGLAIKGVAASIGSFMIAAGPYIAIIALIVAGIVALYYALTKNERALEASRKTAQDLTNTFKETTEAAKELKETISNFSDASKELEDLGKNTREYREQLEEVNKQAKELIKNHNLLYGQDYQIQNGKIEFNFGVMDRIQEEMDNRVLNAESNMYFGQASFKRTELEKAIDEWSVTYDATRGNVKRDFTLDPDVQRFNPQTGQYETRSHADEENQQVYFTIDEYIELAKGINMLRDAYGEQYTALKNSNAIALTIANTSLDLPQIVLDNKNAIEANISEFEKLADRCKTMGDAIEDITKELTKNVVQNTFGQQIDQLAYDPKLGGINQARKAQLEEIYATKDEKVKESEKYLEDAIAKNSRIDIGNVSRDTLAKKWGYNFDLYGDDDQSLAYYYARDVMGVEQSVLDTWEYKEDLDGWGTGGFADLEGNIVMGAKSDEEMEDQLYLANIRKDADTEAEKIAAQSTLDQDLANIKQAAEDFGKKFGVDFTDVFYNVITDPDHQMDLSSLFNELTPTEAERLLNMKDVDFQKALGLSPTELELLGYDTWEQFRQGFIKGLDGWKFNMDQAISYQMNKQLGDESDDLKEEVEIHAKQIMLYTTREKAFNDTLEQDAEAAVTVSAAMSKMNKGIQTLNDNIKDWTPLLSSNSKEVQMTVEYAEALEGVSKALGDIFNIDSAFVNTEFVQKYFDKIKLAAEGDVAAIEFLREQLADDIVISIGKYKGLDQAVIDGLTTDLDNLEALASEFTIGTNFLFDDGELDGPEQAVVDMMNRIIQTAQLGTDEANAIFRTMGFAVEYEEASGEAVAAQVPVMTTRTSIVSMFPDLVMESRTQQTGTEPINGQVGIGSFQTVTGDGKKSQNELPKVKNVIKLADANYSNKPTSKKSGGSNSPKKMEPFKFELDRFHDIDIVLKDIQNDLKEIENAQEKAFGKDLLYYYNEELRLLDRNLDATKEKVEIAKEWMNDLRKGNPAMGIDFGLESQGVLFDENGWVLNYETLFLQKEKEINNLIDKYRAMAEGDAKEQYKEDVVEPAKEKFEEFQNYFEKYEELLHDTIPELLYEQEEILNRQIETQIEKFNMEITIRLDLKDAAKDWDEFRRTIIEELKEEDILQHSQLDLDNLKNIYYTEDEKGIIQTGTNHVNNILEELRKMDEDGLSDVYGNNRVRALEDLKTYYTELKNNLLEADQLIKDIQQSYVEMINKAKKAFDNQISTYQQISDLLNHDIKVVQLLYGEKVYADLEHYYQQLEDNNNQQLDFQRQQVDLWKQQMDSIDPEKNKEAWEAARDNWKSSVSDLNSLIESSIQNLQDKYLNTINKIFNDLNNKITDNKGLDYVSEEWDLLEQNSEQFLDEINSLYGIEDIARKYQEAIDNTDNLNVQKKLKDVMEQELKLLREKDKLTEYDIERAEKKYDLTLKQIALEEAQQNKSQLRLRRDSQGNYTYQYVADADEIAKAEQELADARNELYNFDLEQYKEKLGEMYDAYEEFQEKMKEAEQINDPEEKAARKLLIQQQYEELINGLVMQNEDIRNNLYESAFMELSALRGKELEEYTNLTQAEKDLLMNDLIPQWDSGIQHMADKFAAEGGFIPTCEEALNQLKEATNDYQTDLDELEQAAGIDFETIRNGIDQTVDETQNLLLKNDELITSYENELLAIEAVLEELDGLIEKYDLAKDAAIEATKAAYEYWSVANNNAADAAESDKYNPVEKESEMEKSESPSFEEAAKTETPTEDGVISIGDEVTFIGGSGRWYETSEGKGKSGTSSSDKKVTVTRINTRSWASHPYHIDQLGWVKKSQLTGYDTGGYTGSWGDEGKLALLHQKELVLNAQDTANMLNAVEILRDITNTIGTTMLNRLAQVSSNANGILAGLGTDALEQNVHIDATFPNVQSSNEIENAFKNLTNIAAQRIYRS